MGAVHGVHLKYVAMSIGCVQTARSIDSEARFIAWSAFWYCAVLHALIAACFVLRVGMPLIGKSAKTGQVPWWSYVIFWGFHLPTWLYTDLHTRHSVSTGTPVATEVVPGWWIGGRYGNRLKKKWAVTIDLTCEFPEACREVTGPSALPPTHCVSTRCHVPYRLRLPPRRRRVPLAPVLGRRPAHTRADRTGRPARCGWLPARGRHGPPHPPYPDPYIPTLTLTTDPNPNTSANTHTKPSSNSNLTQSSPNLAQPKPISNSNPNPP